MAVILADTEEWHEARRTHVTGTAAAALMGLSPWGDASSTLKDYISGRTNFKRSRKMEWGQLEENNTVDRLMMALGVDEEVSLDYVNFLKTRGPLAATIDASASFPKTLELDRSPLLVSAHTYWRKYLADPLEEQLEMGNLEGLIEAKLTSEKNIKFWGKEPPPYYWAQCQLQMYCWEYPWCILVARVGAYDMRAHLITPCEEFIEDLLPVAESFLEQVKEQSK